MYKLLIVDDENLIVNWLYELFQGEKQYELDTYKANSVTSALEILNKAKIDIVLCDICMPGKNGIELLEIIKNKWPECRVIFLTGYNEFEYVYTAIKYKEVKYLLKTEGDVVIKDTVKGMIKEIEKDHKDLEIINKAIEHRKQVIPLLQKEFLKELLGGEILSCEVIQTKLNDLDIQLSSNIPVIVMLGSFDGIWENTSSSEKEEKFYAIKLIVEKYLSDKLYCFNIVYDHNVLVWFMQPNRQLIKENNNISWDDLFLFVKDTMETIQVSCRKSLEKTVSFVLQAEPSKWIDISKTYSKLKKLLNYSVGLGNEMLVTDKNLFSAEMDNNDSFVKVTNSLKKMDILENYLERGQKKEFYKLLSAIIGAGFIEKDSFKDYYPALQVYYGISMMFLSYIQKWKLSEKLASKMDLRILTRNYVNNSWSEVSDFFYRLSENIFEIQKNHQEYSKYDSIKCILQYIDTHFKEEISLIKLSELVYFNPSYLSRLFKQSTGMNISDYILNLRLEKSKELLRNSSLRIHEIASAVGYESPHYFARFFKKVVNMTPQEYRDNLRKVN